MKLYSKQDGYTLYQGNMLDMLEVIELNSIDSIVTDPPYELNFMNKGWDNAGVSFQVDTWKKCFDVLKPGGYLLAFGGTRTYHRIACAIEDAGFEIRDCIMWLYGSGFPKSMDIAKAIEGKLTIGSGNPKDFSKLNSEQLERGGWGIAKLQKQQGYRSKDYDKEATSKTRLGKLEPTTELARKYSGWGTCLKPAYEPIIVARKPFKGSLVDNVIENGVGGLNIDECRVGNEQRENPQAGYIRRGRTNEEVFFGVDKNRPKRVVNGRFPANVILTYDETDFDEVCGGMPYTKSNGGKTSMPDLRDVGKKSKESIGIDKLSFGQVENAKRKESDYIAPSDSGLAARYFYCAKASKKDRDEGLDEFEKYTTTDGRNKPIDNPFLRGETERKNTHPTVKPTALMQYLVRLVTPKGGTILDPFMGSGSTGKAVMYENKEYNKDYKFIGIELTEEYLPIAEARINYVYNKLPNKEHDLEEFLKGL